MIHNMTIEQFTDELRRESIYCFDDRMRSFESKSMYHDLTELIVRYVMYTEKYKEKRDVQDNHTDTEGDRTDKTGDPQDLPFK